MFTTPAERSTLDHLRQTRKIEPVTDTDQPLEVIEAAPVTPPEISVQGYVKRSDGKKGTVWINQKPVQENSTSGGVEVGKLPTNGNQVQIKVPGLDKSLKLKAGQIYDPETDSVSEDKATRSNTSAINKDIEPVSDKESDHRESGQSEGLPAEIKKYLSDIIRR